MATKSTKDSSAVTSAYLKSASVNVPPSTPFQVYKALDLYLASPDYIIGLIIWGESGIGKTQMVKQYAKEKGFGFNEVSLAQMCAGDLMIPSIDDFNSQFKYCYNENFINSSKWCEENPDKLYIMLLDELSACSDDITAQTYQILASHRLGNLKFPRNLRFIATGNRPEDGTMTKKSMDVGTATRIAHLWMVSDTPSWLEYANSKGFHHLVTAYIGQYPAALTDSTIDDKVARARPRTWEMVSHILHNIGYTRDVTTDTIKTAIISCIGEKAGNEFIKAWQLLNSQVPDIHKLMTMASKTESLGTVDLNIKEKRPDNSTATLATMQGVLNYTSKAISTYTDVNKTVTLLAAAARVIYLFTEPGTPIANGNCSRIAFFERLSKLYSGNKTYNVLPSSVTSANVSMKLALCPLSKYTVELRELSDQIAQALAERKGK